MSSTICISLSISTEQQFFIKIIKSNQLKIITRDAGASGLHSNTEHWNEELFVLFNKNLPYCHFVKFYCLKPDNKAYFELQFPKSIALPRRVGTWVTPHEIKSLYFKRIAQLTTHPSQILLNPQILLAIKPPADCSSASPQILSH